MTGTDKPIVCPNCNKVIDDNTIREALLKEAKVVKCPHCGKDVSMTHEIVFHTKSKFTLPPEFKREKG